MKVISLYPNFGTVVLLEWHLASLDYKSQDFTNYPGWQGEFLLIYWSTNLEILRGNEMEFST